MTTFARLWFQQEFIQNKIKDIMNRYVLINKLAAYRLAFRCLHVRRSYCQARGRLFQGTFAA